MLLDFFENYGTVMSAKAKCIAKSDVNVLFLSLVKSEIQSLVKAFIIGEVVDGWWN